MSLRGGAAAAAAAATAGTGASYRHRQQLDRYVDVPVAQPASRLAKYFGMARQVLGQGQAFEAQGDLDRAYIFYKRFLRLAVDCIPAHPEYKLAGTDKAWLVAERRTALAALEKVSAALDREFGGHPPQPQQSQPQQPATAPPPASKAAAGASDGLETDLERRLRALRGGDGEAGVSATRLLVSSPLLDDDEAAEEAGGTAAPPQFIDSAPPVMPEPSAPPLSLFDDGPALSPGAEASSSNPAAVVDFDTAFRALRVSEDDLAGGKGGGLKYYPALPASPAPAPAKPPAAVGGDGGRFAARGQLRPLVLASGLIGKFLEIAEPNSRKPPDGIETCGVLAGVQDQGQVRFTTLIIPKQEGTGNTVHTTHEEELYFYCEAQGLIMLGWIHTHPSQDCFMSSVDIHTHCGYQTMLPEAVAVVVSLRDARKRVGVFRLTEPDGMQLIQQCTLRGFHPHPLPDDLIYKDHHRVVWEDTGFRVVDQR